MRKLNELNNDFNLHDMNDSDDSGFGELEDEDQEPLSDDAYGSDEDEDGDVGDVELGEYRLSLPPLCPSALTDLLQLIAQSVRLQCCPRRIIYNALRALFNAKEGSSYAAESVISWTAVRSCPPEFVTALSLRLKAGSA